ncbi:pentatricopeptide repeat-containing protein At1g77360, mitochondrial-like [Momordica charantia]|uniref:Pentatricopeptide repeat-containing protein At1g77360, mitochondrial-like n=1 Tax=Momordica charantia TaxID=3673 RepID=A0A6J1CJ17_MOMCH|nr:pentatricopeptide repeat-containing protein At1g77360, mitochondrial-like [Momordica charantia]
MGENNKRRLSDHHPQRSKKHPPSSSPSSAPSPLPSSSVSQQQFHGPSPERQRNKIPHFVSYLEFPNLPFKVKLLCEIIANSPSIDVERILEDTGVQVTQEDVEEVLKLSYKFPGSSVKFFRWSGRKLNDQHSPYAWNLIIDMLGKNLYFEPMWDAMKSMKKEGLLSLATFASVFSSYIVANCVKDAIMTFEVMDSYGCPHDVVALNSLLSAICRDGNTKDAYEFLQIAKDKIRPDPDSYAILLEGWETEGNVVCSKQTFGEMVEEIGWDPTNTPAYNSFLCVLLKGPDGLHEALRFFKRLKDKMCYPGFKFFKVALDECVKNGDAKAASYLWNEVLESINFQPDTHMYNSMIVICCHQNDTDAARRLLDQMICYGAFPDMETYNLLFQFLLKSRKLRDASAIFDEMIKNEFVPSRANCNAAVRIYIESEDPNGAIKVWKCMLKSYESDLEDIGNFLIVGLQDQKRLPEAVKYAHEMIDRGVMLKHSTLSKLKQSLHEVRKEFIYDELMTKLKVPE